MVSTPNNLTLETPAYDMDSSIRYMMEVTFMVMSQVAWYRDLCPKTEFREINILGQKVQFLNMESNHTTVQYLKKHLNGAFELMYSQQLKTLTVLIRDETQTYCLESYSLSYKYDNSSPALSYATTTSSASGTDCPIEYVHNSTMDLLMRLETTLAIITKKPLPDVCVLEMDLFFCHDGLTNHIPSCFRLPTAEEARRRKVYLESPIKLRTGKIKSTFTSMVFHSYFARNLVEEDSPGPVVDLPVSWN